MRKVFSVFFIGKPWMERLFITWKSDMWHVTMCMIHTVSISHCEWCFNFDSIFFFHYEIIILKIICGLNLSFSYGGLIVSVINHVKLVGWVFVFRHSQFIYYLELCKTILNSLKNECNMIGIIPKIRKGREYSTGLLFLVASLNGSLTCRPMSTRV